MSAGIIHDGIQANISMHGSRRVRIEQAHLRKRRRSHEVMGCIGELRVGARLEATTARHAFGKLVSPVARFLRHAGARTKIEHAIDVDPSMHALKMFEELLAIDLQIAHERELRERRERDGLLERIDECRTCLPCNAVDQHRASSAYFFEAHALPHHGRGGCAISKHRMRTNIHERRNHIHVRMPFDLEIFIAAFCLGAILTLDMELDGLR